MLRHRDADRAVGDCVDTGSDVEPGFFTRDGFICGAVVWGGFNTALKATNTETFCLSCHEMRANAYQELSRTVHVSNRSRARAICTDCQRSAQPDQ